MNDVGLSIIEGEAKGASAYREPSKRNIGLLGQFTRGVGFSPTKVTGMESFRSIFGGQSSSFFGPSIVKSIFDEAENAPVTLYIARVIGEGSKVATVDVALGDDAVMSVSAGYKGKDDPGEWANGIRVTLYSFGYKTKGMFTLLVTYGDEQEQYNYATLAEVQAAVNKVSKYITIDFSAELPTNTARALTGQITCSTSSNHITGVGTKFTEELHVGSVIVTEDNGKVIGTVKSVDRDTEVTLEKTAYMSISSGVVATRVNTAYQGVLKGGIDGEVQEKDFYPVESTTNPKGLACFEGYDVQILACTEYHSLSMAKELNAFLKKLKNPIGVINLPLNADEGTAEMYANELQTNGVSFLAGAYLGWCKVLDENANPILIPAIGPVLGAAYIRTPYLQGDYIHIPPGGTDSLFHSVLEVIPNRLSQSTINTLVQQFSCNVIQYIENTGYYVGSSRSYSTKDLYSSIHIRQQTSYYLRALNSKMRFMEQKPNTPELKREALVTLNRFFKAEYDNGALERSIDFDEAYQGICDKSNNPSTQDRKLINITVLWIPTECTESIKISLQRNDGILTTMEE